jgi:hypothetical protein
METDRQKLATQALGRPVGGWIADMRAGRVSYRDIAAALREVTEGEVRVSAQTIFNWDPTR